MSDITPLHGEALAKALESQKPDPNATAESMATVGSGFGVLHPSYGSRVAADEARRDAAHAKAMKSGWTTSEGVLTALVAIGGLATAFGTMATFMEDLARLFPQYGALAAGGIILGALGTAAKAVGDYAKARSAVKGAGRFLAILLAVGLSTGCVNFRPPAPSRAASLAPEAAPFEFQPPPECKEYDRDRKVWGALGRSAALGSGAAGLTSLVTDNDSGGLRRGFGLASLALGIFAAGASWYADQQAADFVSRCTQQ